MQDEPTGKQLTLRELFVLTTSVAGAFGLYLYISPLLSRVLAACLLLYAVLRWCGLLSPVLGGILGFWTALGISVIMVYLSGEDGIPIALPVFMFFPVFGYVAGYIMIMNQNDPFS